MIWLWGIHFHPKCQFMILLLLRECSCLLTRYLPGGVGVPGNPVRCVCWRSDQNWVGYGSPWAFYSSHNRVWGISLWCSEVATFGRLCWAKVLGSATWDQYQHLANTQYPSQPTSDPVHKKWCRGRGWMFLQREHFPLHRRKTDACFGWHLLFWLPLHSLFRHVSVWELVPLSDDVIGIARRTWSLARRDGWAH